MWFDCVIFGCGFYGLYAAKRLAEKGSSVLVIEKDACSFARASYINQARVHMGYHYPRSLTTALASARYFKRFYLDFQDCINTEFEQIYSTGTKFSWTTAVEFKRFCQNANIPCEEVDAGKYFKNGMCDGVFRTIEYTYDAAALRDKILSEISDMDNVTIRYSCSIDKVEKNENEWVIYINNDKAVTSFIVNATYAGVNEIHQLLGYEPFKIKYEKCEIILCESNNELKSVGLTVMDGPFFSIMPFGNTNFHSLTSVSFTPHETSYNILPTFGCQVKSKGSCRPDDLKNCNDCDLKPASSWDYMSGLARKYISERFEFKYKKSLYVIKPILQASEIDDSRPTVIREVCKEPKMISVLSGKINTVYDLEEMLF